MPALHDQLPASSADTSPHTLHPAAPGRPSGSTGPAHRCCVLAPPSWVPRQTAGCRALHHHADLLCSCAVQAQTVQLQADKQSLLSKLETQTQRMELAVQQAAAAALQAQHSVLHRVDGQGSPVQRAGLGALQSARATPQLDRGRSQSGACHQTKGPGVSQGSRADQGPPDSSELQQRARHAHNDAVPAGTERKPAWLSNMVAPLPAARQPHPDWLS